MLENSIRKIQNCSKVKKNPPFRMVWIRICILNADADPAVLVIPIMPSFHECFPMVCCCYKHAKCQGFLSESKSLSPKKTFPLYMYHMFQLCRYLYIFSQYTYTVFKHLCFFLCIYRINLVIKTDLIMGAGISYLPGDLQDSDENSGINVQNKT